MGSAKVAKIEKYEAKDGFRWRFRAPNGLIMADSAEAYSSKQALEKAIRSFIGYITSSYGTTLVIEWVGSPKIPLREREQKDGQIEEAVFRILQDQLAPGASFTLGWKLVDDCGADSLDAVEITMAVEDEFGIEIPDEDAEKFTTGQDIVNYIQERT